MGEETPIDTSSQAPVVDPPASITTTDAPPDPSPGPGSASEPNVDGFGWDKWDRSSFDAFPEPVRPWAQKLTELYKGEYEGLTAEAREQQELYRALTQGLEHPKLTGLEKENGELKGWQKNALENLEKLRAEREAEREASQKQIEEIITRQAEAEVQKWKEAHPWIFDGGEKQHTAGELFDEGFEMDVIPELLKQPAEVIDRARSHHRDLKAAGANGVGRQSLLLAKADFQPPKPSAAAEQISGAAAPHPGPPTQGKPPTNASLKDLTAEVARSNWEKFRG